MLVTYCGCIVIILPLLSMPLVFWQEQSNSRRIPLPCAVFEEVGGISLLTSFKKEGKEDTLMHFKRD